MRAGFVPKSTAGGAGKCERGRGKAGALEGAVPATADGPARGAARARSRERSRNEPPQKRCGAGPATEPVLGLSMQEG